MHDLAAGPKSRRIPKAEIVDVPLKIKIVGQEGLRECVEGCPGFSGRFVQDPFRR